MLTLPPGARVFVATARVDGRKGIDGLSAVVRSHFAQDPLSGTLYVFFSKRGDRVRVLYWDRDGYVLVTKRLEKGGRREMSDYERLPTSRRSGSTLDLPRGDDYTILDTKPAHMAYAPHRLSMEKVASAFSPEDRVGALEMQNVSVARQPRSSPPAHGRGPRAHLRRSSISRLLGEDTPEDEQVIRKLA